MKLEFEQNCFACPEQYDVYVVDYSEVDTVSRKTVGYIRLRWGSLRAYYPDYENGELIYSHDFHEECKGCFSSEDQRAYYLNKIEEIIKEKLRNDNY